MRLKPVLKWLLLAIFACGGVAAAPAEKMSLAGRWRFELDPQDVGNAGGYFRRDLAQTIALPGILQAQGYGDEISTNTPWVLSLYDPLWFQRDDYKSFTKPGQVKVPFVCQPERHYLGVAWYQRDIEIPKEWEGRRVVLFLERTRWETRAWLDDKLVGTNRSLCTPHEFDFGIVTPGKHRLTVRVDNRMLLNYRPDAHAVSDSVGSTWNGIVGQIELRSTPPVWIEDLQIHAQPKARSVVARVTVGSRAGQPGADQLLLVVGNPGDETSRMRIASTNISWSKRGQVFELAYPWNEDFKSWDEFSPARLVAAVTLRQAKHTKTVEFGGRDFKSSGREFMVNGRPTHLRGTHHGGDFPFTGYPPCNVEYWRKLFQTCKEWGLNHMRFHSFCPPEAAFTAADELGFYLQIEPGMWNTFNPDSPMEAMLYEESEAIIRAYGNHPSFVLFSASNEPKGRWTDVLPKWAAHYRAADPRRLYTTASGFTDANGPGPLDQADFTVTGRFRTQRIRGEHGWFGRDYSHALTNVNIPAVTHELGQWCAYPDFDVIKKFTGFIRPGNYEIFRDSANANGVLESNQEFAYASGRYQLACYKEEIEANLRTPGLGGFQLLDLHDYTGQGTALVGLLDPFWEEKGYVKADEWRQFCSKAVLLATLKQRVFTTSEKLEANVLLANYGASQSETFTAWKILDESGKAVTNGSWRSGNLALGRTNLGGILLSLSQLKSPARYRLWVALHEGQQPYPGEEDRAAIFGDWRKDRYQAAPNSWNFWLYPAQVSPAPSKDVLVTSSWNEAETFLAAGGKVLFLPRNADLDWSGPPLDSVPVFWNRLMNPQWGRMLGLWCDTNHPALAGFPTEVNCDWQWTQITRGARAVNVGRLPRDLKPIVAAIDDWNRNWKLAPIFEARVGKGRLLVCSFDLTTALAERVVARQLRRSLLDYAASDRFQPQTAVAPEQLRGLWFDTLVMHKLGATVTASSGVGAEAIDGDPNTAWIAGGRGRDANTIRHPHVLTIAFPNTVSCGGVVVMNRQNDRDHAGDIREYSVELSVDGTNWMEVTRGNLASTWSPQTIAFGHYQDARFLRFVARSGYGADAGAALAELAVLRAGGAVAENGSAPVRYRRVRSTSSDVDEGNLPANP